MAAGRIRFSEGPVMVRGYDPRDPYTQMNQTRGIPMRPNVPGIQRVRDPTDPLYLPELANRQSVVNTNIPARHVFSKKVYNSLGRNIYNQAIAQRGPGVSNANRRAIWNSATRSARGLVKEEQAAYRQKIRNYYTRREQLLNAAAAGAGAGAAPLTSEQLMAIDAQARNETLSANDVSTLNQLHYNPTRARLQGIKNLEAVRGQPVSAYNLQASVGPMTSAEAANLARSEEEAMVQNLLRMIETRNDLSHVMFEELVPNEANLRAWVRENPVAASKLVNGEITTAEQLANFLYRVPYLVNWGARGLAPENFPNLEGFNFNSGNLSNENVSAMEEGLSNRARRLPPYGGRRTRRRFRGRHSKVRKNA